MVDNSTIALTNAMQHLNYVDSSRAAIILAGGWLLAKGARLLVSRFFASRLNTGDLLTFQRVVYYSILLLFLMSALRQIGFNLEVLLGAAGIFTVAFGFASQTSASNLVSGLFLLAERPFLVGDVIKVNDVTGKVLSIDLLSTKIIMDDNTYIRIPNELLIKSQIANVSRFDVKRMAITLIISSVADLKLAETTLLDIADNEALVIKEPKPAVKDLEIYDYGIKVQLLIWCKAAEGDSARNNLIAMIHTRFRELNIPLASEQTVVLLGREHANHNA